MSNFHPSLVWDENHETGGWTRMEMYGNAPYARMHIPRARGVLGQLKCDTGSNQQMVDDRDVTGGGGFRHRWVDLSDGTKIHAMMNDGHDTLRIYSPGFFDKKEKTIKREDDFDPSAYLWVGIRMKDGARYPFYALDAYLLEPEDTRDDAQPGRGMVNCGFSAIGNWSVGLSAHFEEDEGRYTMVADDASPADGANAQEMADAMYHAWYVGDFSDGSVDDDPFSSTMVQGDHSFDLGVRVEEVDGSNTYSPYTEVSFTRNGLFMMGYDDSSQFWGPYDPHMDADQNLGSERDISGRVDEGAAHGFPSAMEYVFGWDIVCWIDPFADRKEVPKRNADKRPRTLAMQKFLRENEYTTKGRKQIIPGTYMLVVRAYDTPVQQESDRAGEYIGGAAGEYQGGEDSSFAGRSLHCDYQGHMHPANQWPPLEVEVEIRIGRLKGDLRDGFPLVEQQTDTLTVPFSLPGKTFRFDLTCEEYDERYAVVYPHGANSEFQACGAEGGPNMGGPSFSQVIGINVLGKEAEIIGDVSNMAPFLGASSFAPFQEQLRRPCYFYISTAFPVPDPADWPTLAGTALFVGLEAASSGTYGCSDLGPEISEGECQAMFAGTSQTNVYRYDATNGGLENMGPPTGSHEDWDYHSPPFDSTNFYWFYPYGVAHANACERAYGIVVTSVGGFYEMTTNYVGATGFTNPDCCNS